MSALPEIRRRCRSWAAKVNSELGPSGIHLFGSAVNRDGDLFDASRSDLDLIVVIPDSAASPTQRAEWLARLKPLKLELELNLLPVLHWANSKKPISSLVAITAAELRQGIHKSKDEGFYAHSNFENLLEESEPRPLLPPGIQPAAKRIRDTAAFVQSVRNAFLQVSPSDNCRFDDEPDPEDPVPKDVMRHAAIAGQERKSPQDAPDVDLRNGLDRISRYLFEHREDSSEISALHDVISVRRGARGTESNLLPQHRLLLAECLLELAAEAPLPADSEQVGTVPLNGLKLRSFRYAKGLTTKSLAEVTAISESRLRRLESVTLPHGPGTQSIFQLCTEAELKALELALDCESRLKAGTPDDFTTRYILDYSSRNGKHRLQTRIVAFDFDGTLTHFSPMTTWEALWVRLGYPVEDCAQLHREFQSKHFTHQEWCEITRDRFRDRGLRAEHVNEVASGIRLIDGVVEAIQLLKERGIRVYVVSGSIKQVIRRVLGKLWGEFEEVHANDMEFGADGALTHIHGTIYDFEGKAKFLRRLMEEHRLTSTDVLYIGNSRNDVFASRSGARTLCVNAVMTDPDNVEQWTYAIRAMSDLREIIPYVELTKHRRYSAPNSLKRPTRVRPTPAS